MEGQAIKLHSSQKINQQSSIWPRVERFFLRFPSFKKHRCVSFLSPFFVLRPRFHGTCHSIIQTNRRLLRKRIKKIIRYWEDQPWFESRWVTHKTEQSSTFFKTRLENATKLSLFQLMEWKVSCSMLHYTCLTKKKKACKNLFTFDNKEGAETR